MPSSPAIRWLSLFAAISLLYAGGRGLGRLRSASAPLPSLPPAAAPGRTPAEGNAPPSAAPVPATVTVHVAGCVRTPGVYSFPEGARVTDAVKRAGGAKASADLDRVNLAARIQDGAQIYIPSKETSAARPGGGGSRARRYAREDVPPGRMEFTPPADIKPIEPPAGAAPPPSGGEGKPEKLHSPSEGRVNINRAGLDELQRLPNVGPATARKILDYRSEHGTFGSVDELLEIQGIGEKKLEQMRALIEL